MRPEGISEDKVNREYKTNKKKTKKKIKGKLG